MPTYAYVARDAEGKELKGEMVAVSASAVRHQLRLREIFMTRCHATGATGMPARQSTIFAKKVKLGDLVVMSRQMATLVRAGLPIVESLGSLADQTENPTLADILRQMRFDVLSGMSLTQAMSQHPKVFNNLYIALVEAGETGGTLDQTLEVAAEQFDQEAELREQVKTAVFYPTLVVVAAVGVIVFMLFVVVPVFAKVYAMFKHDLPGITLFLMNASDFALKYWWLALLVGVGVFVGIRLYGKTDTGRHRIDAAKLHLPLVGKLLRKISLARFTQTWSGMTKGGVPILQALRVSGNVTGNVIIRDAITDVSERIKDGSVMSLALAETKQFPPMVTRMVAAGEQSGNLDEMLDEIVRFYKRDIEYSVQRLAKLLEPIMTVLVGGIVLVVLLALYMPIFNLSNVVKR